MTTWVIGDVHGCFQTLARLLERISWQPGRDRLLLVGDLVNKGTRSLEVLRWAVAHDEHVEAVLGNHDLHLLACSIGVARRRSGDALDEVLAAPDAGELLAWLRDRPLIVEHGELVVVHAGLHPSWTRAEAWQLAETCHRALADDHRLAWLWKARKTAWQPGLEGDERLAAALAVLTMVRMVAPDGRPLLEYTGRPAGAPPGARPWFDGARVIADNRRRVAFGHWALLGLHRATGARCLDGACVYGGQLAAWSPDDDRLVVEPARPEDLEART